MSKKTWKDLAQDSISELAKLVAEMKHECSGRKCTCGLSELRDRLNGLLIRKLFLEVSESEK